MTSAWDILGRLHGIGGRGAGTRGCLAAAEELQSILRAQGLSPVTRTVRAPSRTLYDGPPVVALMLLLLGAALFVGPPGWRTPLAFFMWLALMPLVGEILAIPITLDLFLRKHASPNIQARVAGDGPGEIVLVAHYDTQFGSALFAPGFVPYLRTFFLFAYLGFFGLAIAGAVYALWDVAIAHLLMVPTGIILFASMAFVRYAAGHGTQIEGANDNASGTAVAIETALRLREDVASGALDGHGARLTLLLTTAEEVGERGMLHYLRQERPDHHGTVFVNLDNVGGGTLRYLTEEGMVMPMKAAAPLLRLAEGVAAAHPGELTPGFSLVLPTDLQWAFSMGYAGITFIGQTDDGQIPDYHSPYDTVARLDPDHIGRVVEIVHAFTKAVWREAAEVARKPAS